MPWARPGAGAVATQSNVEVTYGPRGLELMQAGVPAAEALGRLLAADPNAATRQSAAILVVPAEGEPGRRRCRSGSRTIRRRSPSSSA